MHPPSAFAPDPCSLPLCSVRSHSAFCRPVSALRPPDDRTQNSAAAPSPTCSYPVQRRPSLLLIDAHTALRHTSSTVALPSFSPLCPASLHGPRPRCSTRPSSHTAERAPRVLLRRHALLHGRHGAADTCRKQRRRSSPTAVLERVVLPRPAPAPPVVADRGQPVATSEHGSVSVVTSTPSPGQAQACARTPACTRLDPAIQVERAPCGRGSHAWREARTGPLSVRGRTRTRRGHVDQRLVHAVQATVLPQVHGQPSPARVPALPSRCLLLLRS